MDRHSYFKLQSASAICLLAPKNTQVRKNAERLINHSRNKQPTSKWTRLWKQYTGRLMTINNGQDEEELINKFMVYR